MGANSIFHGQDVIDASQDPLALSSDFHSGPFSVIIPFGIWGVLLWLWYAIAGYFVVSRNYRNGDPDLGLINRYLYAVFIAKCFIFLFVFGDAVGDMAGFAGVIGLSIALNHGIGRPQPLKKAVPAKPRSYSQTALPALAQ
jgi:choline-glycine betaine transporter